MQPVSFKEIENLHKKRRCETLEEMSKNMDPLTYLNTALLDNGSDAGEVKRLKEELEFQGHKYKLVNVADSIQNSSRLKIAYLLPYLEVSDETGILIEQSNKLAARGHDVLLFSHCPKPDWIECTTRFFPVHQGSNLSDVIASTDIVIACGWHLVVEALKVDAPLKYYFVQEDTDLLRYDTLDENMKNLMGAAYSLPLKLLTISSRMKLLIERLFGRKAVLMPDVTESNVLPAKDAAVKKFTWNTHIKKLEKEFKMSALSTIQAVKMK